MNRRAPLPSASSAGTEAEWLCELMLQIVGKNAGRMSTARRHVEVLQAAMPHMTPAQLVVARERIGGIETKWGALFPRDQSEPKTNGIPPETRIATWLSTRTHPGRLSRIIYRAAEAVWSGQKCFSAVIDYAYAKDLKDLDCTVGFDSFKEWLIQLRIVEWTGEGEYRPGAMCEWWIDKMIPDYLRSPTYRRCLKLAEDMRYSCPRKRRRYQESKKRVSPPDDDDYLSAPWTKRRVKQLVSPG